MKRVILSLAAVSLAGFWGCNHDNPTPQKPQGVNVVVNVVSDLQSKAAGTTEENQVNSFDLFVFDAASGELEEVMQNVTASAPSPGTVAGEQQVGEVQLTLKDNKTKNLVVVANVPENSVEYKVDPALKSGTYAEMMQSTTVLQDYKSPESPFVMSGYANSVTVSETETVHLSLRRRTTKLSVANSAADEGLVVSSLHLKEVVDQSYLFQKGHPDEVNYVDYEPVIVSGNTATAFYIFPQAAATNRVELEVEGTLNGTPFSQTLPIQPRDEQQNPLDMDHNTQYTIKLTAEAGTISGDVTVGAVEEWGDGPEIPGVIGGGKPEGTGLVAFNGLQWMDRNLGARSADFEAEWDDAIGSFYQWGRNVPFGTSGHGTISAPLTYADAHAEENQAKFITKMNGDWISSADGNLWSTPEKQPCPEGYRLPTYSDYLGIFSTSGVLFNMYGGPKIVTSEPLSTGAATAHYFGDNSNKTLYGIKRQGTAEAYLLKWEYLKTTAGNAYVRISRWPGDAEWTFADKSLGEVRDEFDALTGQPEVITFVGAGTLTGSNGSYSDSKSGYYWSASPNGTGAWRAELTDGKVHLTDPYNSRVSGHSLRCVKQ